MTDDSRNENTRGNEGKPNFPSTPPYHDDLGGIAEHARQPASNPPRSEQSPSASPPADGSYLNETTYTPSQGDNTTTSASRKYWIAGVAGLALIAIVGGIVLNMFRGRIGAETPDEAIERFASAALGEDWLSAGLMIEPTERDLLFRRVPEFMDELERLDLLDAYEDSFDIDELEDILDLKAENIETSVERVNDDIYRGWIDRADITGTYDLSKTPGFAETLGIETSGDIDETLNTRESQVPIALVRRGDRWYVSMWYTIAENIREQEGLPAPDPGRRLQPNGSDSPEEAATRMVESLVGFDFAGSVALLDPTEASALYDYWSLYGDDLSVATRDVQNALASILDVSVTDLGWDVDVDGDDASLDLHRGTTTVRTSGESLSIAFDIDERFITITGNIDGDPIDIRITWQDRRLDIAGDGFGMAFDFEIQWDSESFEITGEADDGSAFDVEGRIEDGCFTVTGDVDGESVNETDCSPELIRTWEQLTSGNSYDVNVLRFHKNDGAWYFSPTSTMIDAVIANLRYYEPEDFDLFREALENGGLRDTGASFLEEGGDLNEAGDFLEEDLEALDPSLNQDPLGDVAIELEVPVSEIEGPVNLPYLGELPATGDPARIVVTLDEPTDIFVESGDFDTTVAVFDAATKELVGYNDDGSDITTDSLVTINEPGEYVVQVQPFDFGYEGTFVVSGRN